MKFATKPIATHLIQHIVNQLNLIRHLRSSQNRQERPLGVLKCLRKELQFLLHEESRCPLWQLHPNHTRMGPMRRPERVVNEHISKLRQTLSKLLHIRRIGFRLLPLFILDRAFFFDVESEVLEQEDTTRCGVGDGGFGLGADAVGEEGDGDVELFGELVRDGFERVFFIGFAVGAAEMGHERNGVRSYAIDLARSERIIITQTQKTHLSRART